LTSIKINGGGRLEGDVVISGAKNACLPLLACSLLTEQRLHLKNVPMQLEDVKLMIELLKSLGKRVDLLQSNEVAISGSVSSVKAPYDYVRAMRASILVLGPLMTKEGEANIPLPGGCNIGNRPINLHIDGLRLMGADIVILNGVVSGRSERLIASKISFSTVSVTGTQNLIMAATLAKGVTQIFNYALEPEVIELIACLNMMGAKIKVLPYGLEIEGVESLRGATYEIGPDRIEFATYLIASVVTNGKVSIVVPVNDYIQRTLDQLLPIGFTFDRKDNLIKVEMNGSSIYPLSFSTSPYPGMATDTQPMLCVVNSLANGPSVIKETIFENRFQHLSELARLGSTYEVIKNEIHFKGNDRFKGVEVRATDLRAAAAMIIGGLAAEGETIITDADYIFRGYEAVVDKLQALGVEIELLN
jgi:UDP-N-acetylglucosamine 1-carboxyvinyltransferase